MSTLWKIALSVIVLALIIWGIVWATSRPEVAMKDATSSMSKDASMQPSDGSTEANAVASRDSSNDSLDKDMLAVDAELKVIDSDSANANSGLNDKEVNQTE